MNHATTKTLLIAATLAASMISWSVPARADIEAVAVPGTTNLREGPSTRYRVLARVRGGSYVHVYGCLYDRNWCEVNVRGIEGWMAASRLQFFHRGRWHFFHERYRYHDVPIIEFHHRYKYRRRPTEPGPVVPPCPFPDPRECQPLGPAERAPGGGGPDYPPNYKGDGAGNTRRGETVAPSCTPTQPGCLAPGLGTVPDTGGPDYPPTYKPN